MEDVWKFSSALWGSPKNDDKSSYQKKTHTTAVHFLAHRHHPYLRPFSFHRENCLTRTRRISHWGEGQLPGYNFSYRPSAPSEIFFKTSSRYQKILRSIEIASLLRRRLNKWKKNHFFSCVFHNRILEKKKIKFFFINRNYFFCDGGAGRNFCKNFLVGGSEEIAVCGGHLKYCINWWVSQQRQVRPPFFPMFCTFLQLEKTRIFWRFFTPHHV